MGIFFEIFIIIVGIIFLIWLASMAGISVVMLIYCIKYYKNGKEAELYNRREEDADDN